MLTPSAMTSTSAKIERGKYARICVEIDLRKRLVPRVIAANTVYSVEYEGLNLICFSCGCYGHRRENCAGVISQTHKSTEELRPTTAASTQYQASGTNSLAVSSAATENTSPLSAPSATNDMFGSWMLVGKSNHSRGSRKVTAEAGELNVGKRGRKSLEVAGSSSRFAALAELEEDVVTVAPTENTHSVWAPVVNGEAAVEKHRAGDDQTRSAEAEAKKGRSNNGGGKQIQGRSGSVAAEELRVGRDERVSRDAAATTVRSKSPRAVHTVMESGKVIISNGLGEGVLKSKASVDPREQRERVKSPVHGPSFTPLGRREHTLVEGNMLCLESRPLVNSNEDIPIQINGHLLLEEPGSSSERKSDAFLKEKCEQSITNNLDPSGWQVHSKMLDDDDIGDDFMNAESHDLRTQELVDPGPDA